MAEDAWARSWSPGISGVPEVFHARYTDHAYGSHVHQAWTLLLVDDGVIAYGLAGRAQGAQRRQAILLPPFVPHDGRTVDAQGFRKRVVYLTTDRFGEEHIGRAVDRPTVEDPRVARWMDRFHRALLAQDRFEAESWLALVLEGLHRHLGQPGSEEFDARRYRRTATRLRDILEERAQDRLVLEDLARELQVTPTHLTRAFRTYFGISPHKYLVARRVDSARRLILQGSGLADAAVDAGFHDQPHLTRHFKAVLGMTPGAYRRAVDRPRAGRPPFA